jgi:hypothetical protein
LAAVRILPLREELVDGIESVRLNSVIGTVDDELGDIGLIELVRSVDSNGREVEDNPREVNNKYSLDSDRLEDSYLHTRSWVTGTGRDRKNNQQPVNWTSGHLFHHPGRRQAQAKILQGASAVT